MLFITCTWFLKQYYVHEKVVHTQKVDSFSTRLLVRGSHTTLILYVNDKNSEARLVANFHHHKIEKISGRLNGLESIYNNRETLRLHKTKTKKNIT